MQQQPFPVGQPYGGQGFGDPAQEAKADSYATWSLVLGLCSLLCTCLTGIPAAILGLLTLTNRSATTGAKTKAWIGIGTGVGLPALLFVVVLIFQPAPPPPGQGGGSSWPSFGQSPSATPQTTGERSASLGQEFSVGQFSYIISGAQAYRRLGNDLMPESPSPGAVFVVVDYTERNDGTETHTGLGGPIELLDFAGRRYEPSSRAQTALIMSGSGDELVPQLQPGIAHQAKAAFEVPESSISSPVDLIVKERGFLGHSKVRVPVSVSPPM